MVYLFIINVTIYQVKMLMFYNFQTTNSAFVDRKNEIHNKQIIALGNPKE